MNVIKAKLAWLSVMLLSAGYVAAPHMGTAQDRRQESRSFQATPNRIEPNNSGRSEENQNRGNSRFNMGRWNNGERWNNNGRLSNNFRSGRSDNRDRGRDRDRYRSRGHFRLYWGAPYYPYSYSQGFYYGVPYGYYPGNSYALGYSDGFNAGRFDRLQGNIYNPRQYERSGDLDYFSGFVAGYEDGWSR